MRSSLSVALALVLPVIAAAQPRRDAPRAGFDPTVAAEIVAANLPGEVSPAGFESPLRFVSESTLEWEPLEASRSDAFVVRRGAIPELRAGSLGECVASGLREPRFVDPDPPAEGGTFYLVGGRNELGEGPLGVDSLGTVRVAAGDSCP